ncbi:MAG TPA: hypothetical protein VGD64_02610 [Acidisarcina sp.]
MRQISILVAATVTFVGTISLLSVGFGGNMLAHHDRLIVGIAMLAAGLSRLWMQRDYFAP